MICKTCNIKMRKNHSQYGTLFTCQKCRRKVSVYSKHWSVNCRQEVKIKNQLEIFKEI